MSRDSQRHYTIDDYFTVEEMSEVKHEYYNGEMFAKLQPRSPNRRVTAGDCGIAIAIASLQ